MVAWADMMRKQIVMPAHLMDDNLHKAKTGRNLFADFSLVAERTGTYTGERPAAAGCCRCCCCAGRAKRGACVGASWSAVGLCRRVVLGCGTIPQGACPDCVAAMMA
jgi:hypothetical protein